MEVQLTDFENAAFTAFIVTQLHQRWARLSLVWDERQWMTADHFPDQTAPIEVIVTRAILVFNLTLLSPLSKVDEMPGGIQNTGSCCSCD